MQCVKWCFYFIISPCFIEQSMSGNVDTSNCMVTIAHFKRKKTGFRYIWWNRHCYSFVCSTAVGFQFNLPGEHVNITTALHMLMEFIMDNGFFLLVKKLYPLYIRFNCNQRTLAKLFFRKIQFKNWLHNYIDSVSSMHSDQPRMLTG